METLDALKVCGDCGAMCCKLGGTDFTKTEMQKVLDAKHQNYFNKIAEDHYEVKCEDGICAYLAEDNSCSIHDVRPLLCRRWPVYTEIKNGKRVNELIDCPLTNLLNETEIHESQKIAELLSNKFIIESIDLATANLKTIEPRFNSFGKRNLEKTNY